MKVTLTKDEKRFLGQWVLASGIAWLVGIILAIVLSYTVVNYFYPRETNLIVGLCVGGAIQGIISGIALLRWLDFFPASQIESQITAHG